MNYYYNKVKVRQVARAGGRGVVKGVLLNHIKPLLVFVEFPPFDGFGGKKEKPRKIPHLKKLIDLFDLLHLHCPTLCNTNTFRPAVSCLQLAKFKAIINN